jgi:molybdopterin molybdotransferase
VHPAELGMMASLGIGEVTVFRKLRVAFFSTGDELKSIGTTLSPGEIYDSNRYTIYGMLQRLSCEIMDMGVVPDVPDALRRAFTDAAGRRGRDHHVGWRLRRRGGLREAADGRAGRSSLLEDRDEAGASARVRAIGDAHFFGLPGIPWP